MITLKEYLDLEKKHPFYIKDTYEGIEKDRELIVEYNKALIDRYPFLLPKNRWTGKVVEDFDYHYTEMDAMPEGWRIAFGDQMLEELREELLKYDYLDKYFITDIKEKYGTLRWYDNGIPIGKTSEDYEPIDVKFGESWPSYDHDTEIIEELGRDNYYESKDFLEMQTPEYKEKNKDCVIHLAKKKILEHCKVWDIINKYEKLSGEVCQTCGKPSKYKSTGWIGYFCEDCAQKQIDESNNYYKDREPLKLEDRFLSLEDLKKAEEELFNE